MSWMRNIGCKAWRKNFVYQTVGDTDQTLYGAKNVSAMWATVFREPPKFSGCIMGKKCDERKPIFFNISFVGLFAVAGILVVDWPYICCCQCCTLAYMLLPLSMPESLPVCGGIYIHHAGKSLPVPAWSETFYIPLRRKISHSSDRKTFPAWWAVKGPTPGTGRFFRHGGM